MNLTLLEPQEKEHRVIEKLVRIRLIRSQTERERLEKAADEDGHVVIAPTHVVEKEGVIVGYLSMGVVPTVLTWLSTTKVNARDSVGVLNVIENLVAAQGHPLVCIPCWEQSPFHPFMQKFGYSKIFTTDIFIKGL